MIVNLYVLILPIVIRNTEIHSTKALTYVGNFCFENWVVFMINKKSSRLEQLQPLSLSTVRFSPEREIFLKKTDGMLGTKRTYSFFELTYVPVPYSRCQIVQEQDVRDMRDVRVGYVISDTCTYIPLLFSVPYRTIQYEIVLTISTIPFRTVEKIITYFETRNVVVVNNLQRALERERQIE